MGRGRRTYRGKFPTVAGQQGHHHKMVVTFFLGPPGTGLTSTPHHHQPR